MIPISFAACLAVFACNPLPAAVLPTLPRLPLPVGMDTGNRKARRRDMKLTKA